MVEQPQHDDPAGQTVEFNLGTALASLADAVEEHVEADAHRDITYALGLERHHPGDEALAVLTDRLITHCSMLASGVAEIPEERRPRRGAAAAGVFRKLAEHGPDSGTLANWSYARHLAQAGRDMLAAIEEHRQAERAAARFAGRLGLPPVPLDPR
ncbi:DUF6415 family natural product biosynthesis protein [Streptomyces sp. NPDC058855]|uniref:DUF6415 family natural product biosynthesis protein n=1 Tax=Streptomyces sp. NPDC058855 TaxID=3346651 RepID=UPI00368A358C